MKKFRFTIAAVIAVLIATLSGIAIAQSVPIPASNYIGHATGRFGGAMFQNKAPFAQGNFHRVWYTTYYDKAILMEGSNVSVIMANYDLSFLCDQDEVKVKYEASFTIPGIKGVKSAMTVEDMSRFEDDSINFMYVKYCDSK